MTPLRLWHVSDTHGDKLFRLPLFGERRRLIVHTGDLLPNLNQYNPNPAQEAEYQEKWVRIHADQFQKWIGSNTFFFVPGNHDYFDPCPMLQQLGIEAVNISDTIVKYEEWTITGFPYVPFDCKPWNYAMEVQQMEAKVEELKDRIEIYGCDIVASHCPPYNILDMGFCQRHGNGPLARMIDKGLSPHPKAWLCGHIHDDFGVTNVWDMLISNAATTIQTLEIRP